MADKVTLTYLNGRGRMESVGWLLAAANVQFAEIHVTTQEQFLKVLSDGDLMFQQVPLVEMDGIKLAQTKAILQYIAEKYGLHGNDMKERVMVNMYTEALIDLMEMMLNLPSLEDPKPKLAEIEKKATERYLPVFEKVLIEKVHLVGGKRTMADVLLLECTFMLEERFCGILKDFGNIKSFQGRMMMFLLKKQFIIPGSKRKPIPDYLYVENVMEVFDWKNLF